MNQTKTEVRSGKLMLVIEVAGRIILRYSLVFFLLVFGAQKWTAIEASGIQPFMQNSPFLSWVYRLFSVQHGSEFIGVIELILGILIAMRKPFPTFCTAGSLGAAFMFLTTLSFFITTPGLGPSDQGFLLKDLTLLGASLWSASEAWQAAQAKSIGQPVRLSSSGAQLRPST
jgi:uncharacterized membrane protein YkgB